MGACGHSAKRGADPVFRSTLFMHNPLPPNSAHTLRLCKDDDVPGPHCDIGEPVTLPLALASGNARPSGAGPSAMSGARRLVAARVDGDPRLDALAHESHPHWSMDELFAFQTRSDEHQAIKFPGQRQMGSAHDPSVISSAKLMQNIEATLDRMQQRLDQFSEALDDVYKFPSGQERDKGRDWRPPAA
jgi:hypothetical protein